MDDAECRDTKTRSPLTMTLIAPHRGQYRFRNPVEGRYVQYQRPTLIEASCSRCAAHFTFLAAQPRPAERDPLSGAYQVVRGKVEGAIAGRGACEQCGCIVRTLDWPQRAYFQVEVPGGTVWAWNRLHLPALRARVAGDKATVRKLTAQDWNMARFIARLPRCATLTRNRQRLIAEIDRLTAQLEDRKDGRARGRTQKRRRGPRLA